MDRFEEQQFPEGYDLDSQSLMRLNVERQLTLQELGELMRSTNWDVTPRELLECSQDPGIVTLYAVHETVATSIHHRRARVMSGLLVGEVVLPSSRGKKPFCRVADMQIGDDELNPEVSDALLNALKGLRKERSWGDVRAEVCIDDPKMDLLLEIFQRNDFTVRTYGADSYTMSWPPKP